MFWEFFVAILRSEAGQQVIAALVEMIVELVVEIIRNGL